MNNGVLGIGQPPTLPPSALARGRAAEGMVLHGDQLFRPAYGTGRAWSTEFFCDFTTGNSLGGTPVWVGNAMFCQNASGSGSNASTDNTFGSSFEAPLTGIVDLATGSTSTGRCAVVSGNTNTASWRADLAVCEFESLVYMPTLATAAEDYVVRVGLMMPTFANYGVWFEYNRATSGNWLCGTGNSSSAYTTTPVAVNAAQWYRLRFAYTSTAARFWINDQPVANNTGNLVSGTAVSALGMAAAHIIKTAGTTSRVLSVDYVWWRLTFNRERTYT